MSNSWLHGFVWLMLFGLLAWMITGCAVAAVLLTTYEVGTTAIGIGQRNQHQDVLEAQVGELRALRADLVRAGISKEPPLSGSEAAREQELRERAKPTIEERSLWTRIRRMLP